MLEVVRRWFEAGAEREDALCCFDDMRYPLVAIPAEMRS